VRRRRGKLAKALPASMTACGLEQVLVVIPSPENVLLRPGVRLCGLKQAIAEIQALGF